MKGRKLRWVAACAAVALTLPSHAGLISSWETGLEGWAAQPSATLTQTTAGGVTDGSSALRVQTTGAYNTTMLLDGPQYAAFFADNNTISLDVTATAADVPAGWLYVWFAVIADGQNWTDSGPIGIRLDGQTHTISWNYQQSGLDVGPNPYWFNLYLPTMSGNASKDGSPTVAFTFDNLRTSYSPAVPEPGSIGVVGGLGALLVRRRRRI